MDSNMSIYVQYMQHCTKHSLAADHTESQWHKTTVLTSRLTQQPLCLQTLGNPWRTHLASRLCCDLSLWITLLILMQTAAYRNFQRRPNAIVSLSRLFPGFFHHDTWHQSARLKSPPNICALMLWATRPGCQQNARRQTPQYGRSVDLSTFCIHRWCDSQCWFKLLKALEMLLNRCVYYWDICWGPEGMLKIL